MQYSPGRYSHSSGRPAAPSPSPSPCLAIPWPHHHRRRRTPAMDGWMDGWMLGWMLGRFGTTCARFSNGVGDFAGRHESRVHAECYHGRGCGTASPRLTEPLHSTPEPHHIGARPEPERRRGTSHASAPCHPPCRCCSIGPAPIRFRSPALQGSETARRLHAATRCTLPLWVLDQARCDSACLLHIQIQI